MNKIRIINGDMTKILPTLPATSVSAAVTDPPYEINFMCRKWDNSGIAFQKETWEAVERVLYPGGFLLAFGGTRTAHRMAVAIEDAGFTINNFIGWVYGSGFPKAQDITKQIDKVPHSNKRDEIKKYLAVAISKCDKTKKQINEECGFSACSYTRISSREDDGWGSALPNVDKWKKMKEVIGMDNRYDDVIVKVEREVTGKGNAGFLESNNVFELDKEGYGNYDVTSAGLPQAKEWSGWKTPQLKPAIEPVYIAQKALDTAGSDLLPLDPFIYNQKCSTKERTIDGAVTNGHPCLKPKKLISYLMRLVAPKGATILDPFMGSGSGALGAIDEGMSYIGVEMDKGYFEIAEKRIDSYFKQLGKEVKKQVTGDIVEWQYE